MARVTIATKGLQAAPPDIEIARLRGLGIEALRALWQTVQGKKAPDHVPRHLLFRILAYRLQAQQLGELDAESQRILGRSDAPELASERATDASRRTNSLRVGTVLGREWNGQMHRVTVMADGFAWNGTTYRSLSTVAFTITGTRWNGPRFFGLREIGGSAGNKA